MESVQVLLVVGIFVTMALLMFLRKIPALIALPLMSVLIALIGGVNINDIIKYVIGEGTLKLHTAYTIAIFGSMLSVILQKTGVAESFIKKGAELSGDNPWIIAVIMLILIILLFTILGGLGAIIMVATIVLPIMASVGIGPLTIAGIFLIGLSIGGTLNIGNWAVYVSVLGLEVNQIRTFALIMFALMFVISLVYITIQLYNDGNELNLKKIIINGLIFLVIFASLVIAYFLSSVGTQLTINNLLSNVGYVIKFLIGTCIILLFAVSLYRAVLRMNEDKTEVHWITYFIPIIPLLLILLFDFDFIASFVIGLVYAFFSTYKKGRLNLFIQSIFQGGAVVMPAVVLMFGIGMLLIAIMGPSVPLDKYPNGWPVLLTIKPLIESIIPRNPFSYVIIFSLFSPLALYRGPLNVWGMGYGLAAVFLASQMNPVAIMGLLLSVGQIQGISDPTNTHNVWLANELRVDVQKILWNTIPYTWIAAALGLIISAILYM
jgi:H+/gluconate symporter-like permease